MFTTDFSERRLQLSVCSLEHLKAFNDIHCVMKEEALLKSAWFNRDDVTEGRYATENYFIVQLRRRVHLHVQQPSDK